MADSLIDKFRNLVTGGASDTLKKADGKMQACPECGNVTMQKKDPRAAARSIDDRRSKATKGNMGD